MACEIQRERVPRFAATVEANETEYLRTMTDARWAEGIYKVLNNDSSKLSGSLVQFTSTCMADGESLKFVENIRVIQPQHIPKNTTPALQAISTDSARRWSYKERSGCVEQIACNICGQTNTATLYNSEPGPNMEHICLKKRKFDFETSPTMWRSPAASVKKLSRRLARAFSNK